MRSKSKFSTFPQRNITSQGHKKQIMKKIRKTKGMMLLARLYYNFECKTCLIYKPASKIPEALVHFPPSPLSMLRCDFKVTWLKQHCKKGGKTTWSKKTSASRFLNEFMGLRFMYLARSYFALNSLHLLQNSPISRLFRKVFV